MKGVSWFKTNGRVVRGGVLPTSKTGMSGKLLYD